MSVKHLSILGSTGSIGRSTLDVIDQHPGRFTVGALAAHSNVDLLCEQYHRYRPEYVCLVQPEKAAELAGRLRDEPVKVLSGEKDLISLAGLEGIDIVVNAVVGAAGLMASIEAVKKGKQLALANKESLVAGGPLFPSLLKKTGAKILPVDSEHSAIWQCLNSGKADEVKNIILTASGGPFRDWPAEKLKTVTVEEALNHPTWNMGPKITIDSATLVNKGLEVIEAVVLFSVPADRVKVVVHPQSIVHSMVEFIDSSVIAQLSNPDMRLPITHALFWPDRVASDYGEIDWSRIASLTFEPPDYKKFPALALAFQVARTGGTAPAVFNAANEVAVAAFLQKSIKYIEIADLIEGTIGQVDIKSVPALEDILDADSRARAVCRERMEKIAC